MLVWPKETAKKGGLRLAHGDTISNFWSLTSTPLLLLWVTLPAYSTPEPRIDADGKSFLKVV